MVLNRSNTATLISPDIALLLPQSSSVWATENDANNHEHHTASVKTQNKPYIGRHVPNGFHRNKTKQKMDRVYQNAVVGKSFKHFEHYNG